MSTNPNNNTDSSSGVPDFPSQLPEDFWNESERLRNIRDYARSRKVSPDAMLHAILAILSAYTDQKCDTGLGRPAAASYYTFIVGPSGAGKNRAIEAAQNYVSLVDDKNVRCISTGSHQGLIQAYMTKKRDGNEQARHGVLVMTDEGAQFVAPERGEDKHTGLRTALCQMYTGTQDPGQANASAETSRSLPGGSYTLGMIVGVQNGFAVKFMKQGAEQGLTQRIAWAGLVDANRVKGVPEKVATTSINRSLLRVATSKPITFDNEITKILLEDDDIRNDPHDFDPGMTGGNPLNAHMPLQLSKTALLLSILHDKTHVDMNMWRLAERAVKTSYQIRDSFIKEAKSEASASKRERLQEKAFEKAVIDGTTEASSSREFSTNRVLDNALKALTAHTQKPLGRSCPKGGHSFGCAWRSLNTEKRGKLAHLKDQLQVMFNEAINEGHAVTQQPQSLPSEAQADVSAMSEAETPVSSESVPHLEAPPVILEELPLPISAQGFVSDEMIDVLAQMEDHFHRPLLPSCGDKHSPECAFSMTLIKDRQKVDKAEVLARFDCRRAEYSRELCEGESSEHKRWTQLINGKFQAEIDRELAGEIQAAETELGRLNEQNKGKPLAVADLSQYEDYQSPEMEALLAGNGPLPGFSEVA